MVTQFALCRPSAPSFSSALSVRDGTFSVASSDGRSRSSRIILSGNGRIARQEPCPAISSCVRASAKKERRSKVAAGPTSKKLESKPSSREGILERMDSPSDIAGVQDDGAPVRGVEDLEKPFPGVTLPAVDRGDILKSCVVTSAGIGLAGVFLRQLSHWGAGSGFPVPDCMELMPYSMDQSEVKVLVALVVGVSCLRQVLLQTWPDFRHASNLSNQQVLGPLKPWDYFLVSVLPGISEELLFRGALLPVMGVDWKGALVAGIIFGALHRSGGRNNAFALWASAVGILYGMGSVVTNSLLVPMAAHSLANLFSVGIWKLQKDQAVFLPSFLAESTNVRVSGSNSVTNNLSKK